MVGEKVTTFEKENNPIPDAIKKLKRGSHKWGVTAWQDYLNAL